MSLKLEIAVGRMNMHDAQVRDVFTTPDSVMLEFERDGVRVSVWLPVDRLIGALTKLAPEIRAYLGRARRMMAEMQEVDVLLAALPMAVPEAAEVVRIEPAEERPEPGEFIEVEPAQEGAS